MGNSGIPWIDAWFDWSVLLLLDIAELLGVSYEELNVWAFCIVLPLVLIMSVSLNVILLNRVDRTQQTRRTRRTRRTRELLPLSK